MCLEFRCLRGLEIRKPGKPFRRLFGWSHVGPNDEAEKIEKSVHFTLVGCLTKGDEILPTNI